MTGKSANIIIVGAGIGGLTLALGLLRKGIDVQIVEVADTIKEVGAGISVPPNALKILWRLGLKDELDRLISVPTVGEIRVGETGEAISSTPFGDDMVRRYGAPYAQLHRADLQKVLIDSVLAQDAECLSLGTRAVDCRHTANGAEVNVQSNGIVSKISGRAVIACDGIRSTIREQLFHNEPPRFTRHVAWRCLIPTVDLPTSLREHRSVINISHHRQLVHYPLRDGTLLNCVAFVGGSDWRDESWTQPGDVSELQSLFSLFEDRSRAVLSAVPGDACFKWAIYDRDPLDSWCDHNVALLGDAAHPMPPYLGQGAAMAIEDAFVLADALAQTDCVADAFASYETQRVERANWALCESRAAGHRFQDANPDASRFDNDQALQAERMFSYEPRESSNTQNA